MLQPQIEQHRHAQVEQNGNAEFAPRNGDDQPQRNQQQNQRANKLRAEQKESGGSGGAQARKRLIHGPIQPGDIFKVQGNQQKQPKANQRGKPFPFHSQPSFREKRYLYLTTCRRS